LEEKVISAIEMTRSRDGSSGVATFAFSHPNIFDASTASQRDATGIFMVDDEGELSTTGHQCNFRQRQASID
jgi:photosystem II protein